MKIKENKVKNSLKGQIKLINSIMKTDQESRERGQNLPMSEEWEEVTKSTDIKQCQYYEQSIASVFDILEEKYKLP